MTVVVCMLEIVIYVLILISVVDNMDNVCILDIIMPPSSLSVYIQYSSIFELHTKDLYSGSILC